MQHKLKMHGGRKGTKGWAEDELAKRKKLRNGLNEIIQAYR